MVNEHKILSALKKVLDSDTAMRKLLKKQTGSTKVFIGDVEPTAVLPYAQLIVTSDPADIVSGQGEMSIYINVVVRQMADGTADTETLSNIVQRMDDLLQNKQLTVEEHRVFKMYNTGVLPTTRHLQRQGAFLGGMGCQIHALRV